MRKSSRFLLGVVVALVAVLALVAILSVPKPTDRDQILQQMQAIQVAARGRSVSGLMRMVSADYHDDALCSNIEQLHVVLARGVQNADTLATDVSPGTIQVAGDTATSKVHVTASANSGASGQTDIVLHWRKEPSHRLLIFPDTVWLVVSAEYPSGFGDE